MTTARRSTIAIYTVALVLPFVLFVALQAAFSMQTQRRLIEGDALARAKAVNAAVDGQLHAEQSALQVLSTSQFIVARDWPGAKARVAVVQASRPAWRDVVLTDIAARREIWATASGSEDKPIRPWVAAYLQGGAQAPAFGDLVSEGPGCPCMVVHVPVTEAGAPRYLLSLLLSPRVFQDILMEHVPAGSTSAMVDRTGTFIARTLDYQARLGKPATRFVREAIAAKDSGLYRGVTYEGVENYTAFETSDLTGWSTHVAVKAGALAGPQRGAAVLTALAALAGLLLAVGIAGYGYRQSQRRRLEEARDAQSQKLAALGQLAAGIAHDFNNLLMVIGNALQRISEKSTDPDLRRPIDNAVAASDRGALLIRQLLAFTRSQTLELGAVDLARTVEDLREIIHQSVGEAVVLELDIAPEARWVRSNRSQLEMALLNLAINAKDAMPAGGSLRIRSRPSANRPGFIDLDVTDTGQGMPRDVVNRAMEPFFTTKPPGKGTGLGLAQVFGVVSQSGGSVAIESKLGVGTRVVLTLVGASASDGLAAD